RRKSLSRYEPRPAVLELPENFPEFPRMRLCQIPIRNHCRCTRGVAGYESYNVLKHLDKAVKSIPDFVVLLVGTNDVTSSLNPRLARLSRKFKHIPHEPTLLHYSRNITSILQVLKKETDSKIAVPTLFVIHEL
ncbi:MAG: hypothetical protein ACWGNV_13215, partial [Bacteroidales bacterium]